MTEPTRFDGPMRILGKGCHIITSLDDWKKFAPPTGGAKNFQDGKSAKEVAKVWVHRRRHPAPPKKLVDLLETQDATSGMSLGLVVPEARLWLDGYRGNTRNTDLAVFGRAKAGPTFVAVEAKARETFGPTLKQAFEKSPSGTDSNRRRRIDQISKMILGRPPIKNGQETEVSGIRYQLVHGVAGALLEGKAQGAAQVVFVVHEFKPAGKSSTRPSRNDKDLAAFLEILDAPPVKPGELASVQMPSRRGLPTLPLFVGKITSPVAA